MPEDTDITQTAAAHTSQPAAEERRAEAAEERLELLKDQPKEPSAKEQEKAAREAAVATERAEPLETYELLSTDDIVEQLDELNEAGLLAVVAYEEGRDKPRSKVVTEAKDRLDAIEASRQEVVPEADPKTAAKEAAKSGRRKVAKTPDDDDEIEPFGKGTLRAQAEKSAHDPDTDDPVEPVLNPDYVAERDPIEAAVFGESPTASGPDDLAQRDAAAQLAAEPLRKEVEISHRNLPETGSTHEQSSIAAENGEIYPDPGVSPEDALAERDKETEKAVKEAEKEAKKAASDLDADTTGLVAYARQGAAPPPGDSEREFEEDPPMSSPLGTAVNVGTKVSRLDFAHSMVGVIVHRHDPIEAGLVDVKWSDGSESTLNVVNLSFEGNDDNQKALEEAYAKSDLRGF